MGRFFLWGQDWEELEWAGAGEDEVVDEAGLRSSRQSCPCRK